MKRLLLVAVLAALAGSGSACDLSPPAATAGGATITTAQLDAQLSAISENSYAQCVLDMQGADVSSIAGAGQYTVSSSFASSELSTLVLEHLIEADLARRGHPLTAASLSDARVDLAAELTPTTTASPCPNGVEGEELVARLPGAFRTQQIEYLAAEEQLAATLGHVDLSQGALRAYYQSHSSQFQEVCLSDIAVESQSQAQSILGSITSGASTFASEAEQNSIDTSSAANGGQIPCVPVTEITNQVITNAIAGLSPGQISQPVYESDSQVWFLIELDGRQPVPFSTAQAQIREQLLSAVNTTVATEFSKLVKAAKVSVDPRFGTWSPAQGIQPPTPPPAKDLLSSAADQPAASAGG